MFAKDADFTIFFDTHFLVKAANHTKITNAKSDQAFAW